ncbi:polyprenyl synthetase family protein [Acidobacteriota bacterium]
MDFDGTLIKYKKIIDSGIETLFEDRINDSKDFLKSSYKYLKEFVLQGGKRLRPIMAIMAYKSLCDQDEEKIYLPAVGIELFHNSSLIHDDIMDENEKRRGMPSMYKHNEMTFLKEYEEKKYNGGVFRKRSERFGVSIAILQGDILYALTESCFTNTSVQADVSRKALDVINFTYRKISEGQILDIISEVNRDFTEDDYFEAIDTKTAYLFRASIQVGAIFSQTTSTQMAALSQYATHIGAAFQLQDDLIDIRPGLKGHALGSDIIRGKRTLLIIKALENSNEKQKRILLSAFGNYSADPGMITAASDVLYDTGSVDYVKNMAHQKLQQGRSYLTDAGLSKEGMTFFEDLANFMANREI